ncbi:ABC transporter ATP-binding protein [Halovulum sp. GXIMD14794]
MATVSFRDIGKRFGPSVAVEGFDLDIADGEFVVLVGPSGCGKTTSLRMLAGLEQPTSGRILLDGSDVTGLPSKERGLAMVFQSYALYPHMTVAENIGFSLTLDRLPRTQIAERVRQAAETLQIGHLLDRKPRHLSGGQRQRVAVARAIIRQPHAFLFDEPLSNLDARLRHDARVEIRRLQQQLGTTTVYVTHDQVEAMTMADRIVVMEGGRIRQVGTPLELYHRPASTFVASFLGAPPTNCLPGVASYRDATGQNFEVSGTSIALNGSIAPGPATLGIRPECLRPGATDGAAFRVSGPVRFVECLGAETLVEVELACAGAAGKPRPLIARLTGTRDIHVGEMLTLSAHADDLLFFSASGARNAEARAL